MSCRHNRQSNETDCVNSATSALGPSAKRPLRETGERFFIHPNLGLPRPKVTSESWGAKVSPLWSEANLERLLEE